MLRLAQFPSSFLGHFRLGASRSIAASFSSGGPLFSTPQRSEIGSEPHFLELIEQQPRVRELLAPPLSTHRTKYCIAEYLARVWEANPVCSLVSGKVSPDELVEKHLCDSLLPLQHLLPTALRIADIGTGGGFPALPLAIMSPKRTFFCFEINIRKRAFLEDIILKGREKHTVARLFPNVSLASLPKSKVDERASHPIPVRLNASMPIAALAAAEQRGLYHVDLVVTRAFGSTADLLKLTKDFLYDGGTYMLYKGQLGTLEMDLLDAEAAVKQFPEVADSVSKSLQSQDALHSVVTSLDTHGTSMMHRHIVFLKLNSRVVEDIRARDESEAAAKQYGLNMKLTLA